MIYEAPAAAGRVGWVSSTDDVRFTRHRTGLFDFLKEHTACFISAVIDL